jgi:hypothetical protein
MKKIIIALLIIFITVASFAKVTVLTTIDVKGDIILIIVCVDGYKYLITKSKENECKLSTTQMMEEDKEGKVNLVKCE